MPTLRFPDEAVGAPQLYPSTLKMGVKGIVPPALYYASQGQSDNPQYYKSPKDTRVSSTPNDNFDATHPHTIHGSYDPDNNSIYINPEISLGANSLNYNQTDRNLQESVLPHEIGHALWENTLPGFIKSQWEHIHKNVIYPTKINDFGYPEPQTWGRPGLLDQYSGDPSHSFAEAYGQYTSNPYEFKSYNPTIYNWFKAVIGREYINRDTQESQTPAAGIPFYWGTPQQ